LASNTDAQRPEREQREPEVCSTAKLGIRLIVNEPSAGGATAAIMKSLRRLLQRLVRQRYMR